MLLGSMATFRAEYQNPINASREVHATSEEKKYGSLIAENLRKLIEPYFLRRMKDEDIAIQENIDPSSNRLVGVKWSLKFC